GVNRRLNVDTGDHVGNRHRGAGAAAQNVGRIHWITGTADAEFGGFVTFNKRIAKRLEDDIDRLRSRAANGRGEEQLRERCVVGVKQRVVAAKCRAAAEVVIDSDGVQQLGRGAGARNAVRAGIEVHLRRIGIEGNNVDLRWL